MVFKRHQTNDYNLEQIQTNVGSSISDLAKSIELNASYVVVDTVLDDDIFVNHMLGRQFQYYWIVRSDTLGVTVCDSPTINSNPSKKLILRASVAARITLKVI